jgi:hypothetical protein
MSVLNLESTVKLILAGACSLLFLSSLGSAQSPPEQASGSIGGKTLTIKYCAPSVHGRKIFGDGGRISEDPNYPVWRAGANEATAFHTDADLDIGGLAVPKGDYTFYVLVSDPNAWQLIISKETGQWGLSYTESKDLGRIKMTMSKPPALIEELKYVISSKGAKTGTITLEWENHIASVPVTVK